MLDVQRVVHRLANSGAPMANNPLLGHLAQGRGRSVAFRALRRLVNTGALAVEIEGSRRRVQVTATGRWTGWGDARPGHAPYLHRKRGEAAPERQRAPQSRPLTSTLKLDAKIETLPPVTGFAELCQYANWPDGQKAVLKDGSPLVCGIPSQSGTSYCAEHLAICYPNHRKTKPARTPMVTKSRPGRFDEILEDVRHGVDKAGDRVYSTEALFG